MRSLVLPITNFQCQQLRSFYVVFVCFGGMPAIPAPRVRQHLTGPISNHTCQISTSSSCKASHVDSKGQIMQPLEPFIASAPINCRYNTYGFGGRKAVVLSTTSWLGGKNAFLGIAFIAASSAAGVCALAFVVLLHRFPRPVGDPNRFSWNRVSSQIGISAWRADELMSALVEAIITCRCASSRCFHRYS